MNIEAELISYLSDALTDYPVVAEVPETFEAPLIVIDLTGQTLEPDHIFRSTVAVQAYHDSKYEASELNVLVIDAMQDFISHVDVSHCEMVGNSYFPDTANKRRRYQSVWHIVHY